MALSLSRILLHVVFSTKKRVPMIPSDVEQDLHGFIAGACRQIGSDAFRVGGTADHVHIACTLPRTVTVNKLVQEVKQSSSKWIKARDDRCASFAWLSGFGAFSFGQSQFDKVIRYVENQHEHRRTKTFKEELTELLERYGVEYDERYLWD
jgi:REP element-mobilizing transposase RayT